ncbi:hypothetical protein U1Q18_038673 [Sarracenia purpurea var. burkii]
MPNLINVKQFDVLHVHPGTLQSIFDARDANPLPSRQPTTSVVRPRAPPIDHSEHQVPPPPLSPPID